MEKIDGTIRLHIQLIGFATIWGLIVFVSQGFSITDLWEAVRLLPEAITAYVIIGFLFIKWIWRWPALQGWFVRIPNLEGTWRGELKSDWINPETGQPIPPIPVALVVKQDYSTVSCTLLTPESQSYSMAADINHGVGGTDLYLTYNYTNRPRTSLRDRSSIHDGAAMLKIIRKPKLSLEGEYWTSRKTAGELKLTFSSKELIDSL